MITSIIKFSFIYFISLNVSFKLTTNTINKSRTIIFIVSSILLGFISHYLDTYFINVKYIIPLFIIWIFISIITENPQVMFIATILSFGISYSLFALLSFMIIGIIYTLFNHFVYLPYPLLALLTGLLELPIIQLLFKIKRFKKGMTFLFSTSSINLATIICLIFILILTPARLSKSFTFAFFLFVLVLAFLIYWWQAQITKSYRRSLELRELESLRTEVSELNLKIERLMEENEKLARITHRDNTLITTLKNSTVKYLVTDFKNSAEAIAARDKLISNINALSAGRSSLPADYNQKTARDFDTSIALLDELLHHADEEAIQKQITFSVHFGTELANFVPKDISENDLVHTVDDLLKNAFKSTLTCEKRIVQLQFYKLGKHFVVEVADSGIPFEVNSLVNMGIEKLTTYPDGSGIGLMDIWNTKQTYGATYHIEEYVTATPFSKKISLTFDKKNRYSIRTWRKPEILQMSKRVDLQVYEHSEK